MLNSKLRIAFAGDRDIGANCLKFLVDQKIYPSALFVSSEKRASHKQILEDLCFFLPKDRIFVGKQFREPRSVEILKSLNLDYIIGVHFPYIVPQDILNIPKYGFLNLHPAYLPFNRGWHTPSWAILENTPIGATLHFMDEGVDTGDIVSQKKLEIIPADTANTLYVKLKKLEYELFVESIPKLLNGEPPRLQQEKNVGTIHKKRDLFNDEIQKLDLESIDSVTNILTRLRALTTNRIEEAAFFELGGKKYRVQIHIEEQQSE